MEDNTILSVKSTCRTTNSGFKNLKFVVLIKADAEWNVASSDEYIRSNNSHLQKLQ